MSAQDAAPQAVNGTPLMVSAPSRGYGAADTEAPTGSETGGVAAQTSAATPAVQGAKAVPKASEAAMPEARVSDEGVAMPEVAKSGSAAAVEEPLPSRAFMGPQGDPQSSGQPAEVITGSAGGLGGQEVFTAGMSVAENEAAYGYFTPRSLNSQFATVGTGRVQSASGWQGWMSRIGELFTQPTAPAWLPSPIPSPPRPPVQLMRRSPQEMRVQPTTHTPSSSSVPAEAIQAEVQRQLGTLLDRLSLAEQENQRLQDELAKERSGESRVRQSMPEHSREFQGDHGVGSFRASDRREFGDAAQFGLGVRDESRSSLPVVPKQSNDPWSAIWEGISGRLGSRSQVGATRADQDAQEAPKAHQPSRQPLNQQSVQVGGTGMPPLDQPNGVIEALAQSVK